MSFPNIPTVDSDVNITAEDAVNLLLASVAFEELGIAHILNAEAEKIQYVLGTLETPIPLETPTTIAELLAINNSVDETLKDLIKKEMLLEFKLEDSMSYSTTTTSSTTTTTTTTAEGFIELGAAWAVGTRYSIGNAQYTTLASDENEKSVVLGLGATDIPVGTVDLLRSGNNVLVTISTTTPYVMSINNLYISNVAPTNPSPDLFPFDFTVTDPADYFTTYTFSINVSDFVGETLYIAAHANILQPV